MRKEQKKAVVLVVANNKGGVGKTAVTQILISYAVCVLKLRVLAVDGDRQGNLSRRTVKDERVEIPSKYFPPIHPDYDEEKYPEWDGVSSLASIYVKGEPVAAYPSYKHHNFKIIPSHSSALAKIEMNNVQMNMSEEDLLQVPSEFFNPERINATGFDLVIADTAPALSPTTLGLLRASTHVLMPFQLEEKSCEGLTAMLHCLHEQNEAKPRSRASKLIGFLANQKSWNKRSNQELQKERLLGSAYISQDLIPYEIRDASDMAKIDTKGADLEMPFAGLSKDSILREDAIRVCNYVFKKLGFEQLLEECGLHQEEEVVA